MKTIVVDYTTLKFYFFASHFKQPHTISEIYYRNITEGWELQFFKNNFYIKAVVHHEDLMKDDEPLIKSVAGGSIHTASSIPEYGRDYMSRMTKKQKDELLNQKIAQFEVTFLKDAIKVLKFEGE